MVVSPSKKADFDVRTFGSLVFHALGCEQDPTEQNVVLFEHGEPEWYTAAAKVDDDGGNDFGHQPQPIVFCHPKR
jgi:hypothetical protein